MFIAYQKQNFSTSIKIKSVIVFKHLAIILLIFMILIIFGAELYWFAIYKFSSALSLLTSAV
jgi:hypothetical protein